jgi:hypothetical protein
MRRVSPQEQRLLAAITVGLTDERWCTDGWVKDSYTRTQLQLGRRLVVAQVADGTGEGSGIRQLFPRTLERVCVIAQIPASEFIASYVASREFEHYSAIPFAYPGYSLLCQFFRFAAKFAVQLRDPALGLAVRLDAARNVTHTICAGRRLDSDLAARVGLRTSPTASFSIVGASREAFEALGLAPHSGAKRAWHLAASVADLHVEGLIAGSAVRALLSLSSKAGEPANAMIPGPSRDTPMLRALRGKGLI